MSKLCHQEDAWIEPDEGGQTVSLYDCDGFRLYTFPAAMPKEWIMVALGFANKAFDLGVDSGKESKACEIKLALGIE